MVYCTATGGAMQRFWLCLNIYADHKSDGISPLSKGGFRVGLTAVPGLHHLLFSSRACRAEPFLRFHSGWTCNQRRRPGTPGWSGTMETEEGTLKTLIIYLIIPVTVIIVPRTLACIRSGPFSKPLGVKSRLCALNVKHFYFNFKDDSVYCQSLACCC